MTMIRLVLGSSMKGVIASFGDSAPAVLVSYAYRDPFIPTGPWPFRMRNWALDSGAYSAFTRDQAVDLGEYIDFALARLKSDPLLVEVFALDVINDPDASLENTEAMWAAGIPAIPTFHSGESWEVLAHMAARYPKIALGGAVGLAPKAKRRWAEQCFSRVYPKQIHGLGFGSPSILMALPFHSTDASTWIAGPGYGRYRGYSDPLRPLASELNTRRCMYYSVEVEWYLRLERYLKDYWAKEMSRLDSLSSRGELPRGAVEGI